MESRPNKTDSDEDEAFANSPQGKHMRYFGGGDDITRSSIKEQNEKLGDSWLEANTNAIIISGLAGMTLKGCPFSMFHPKDAVGVLNHTYSTKIYRPDGYIDEEVWKQLCTYSEKMENDDTTDILTKTSFDQFLLMRRTLEGATDMSGKIKSDGEWEKYWRKFGVSSGFDCYVKLADLRTFFEDSQKVGVEVERRHGYGI